MKRLVVTGFIAASASVYLVLAAHVLMNGHLHEDAYILFQYSRSLAEGQGIVFDRVHGPSEGATDFLWMVLLAGMQRGVGLDLAYSAALLNAAGLASVLWVLYAVRRKLDFWTAASALFVLVSGGTVAGLAGFSTPAYVGLFSLFLLAAVRMDLRWLFPLGLLLCLFRPDGVLLFAGTALPRLGKIFRTRRRPVIVGVVSVVAAGGAYFLWRLAYFGLFLPLPLLVKSRTDKLLAGLHANLDSLLPYVPFALLAGVGFLCAARETKEKAVACMSGAVLLGIALSFTSQGQNFGWRFQFPIVVAIAIAASLCIPSVPRWIRPALAITVLLPVYVGVRFITGGLAYLTNHDYSNVLPQLLAREYPGIQTLAVTEAGRFPYWYDAPSIIDLVGLNSVAVVQRGPAAALQAQRPDFILVNHAGTYVFPAELKREVYFVLDARSIHTQGAYRGRDPVLIAPQAALTFAAENNYLAVAVAHTQRDVSFSHVYFLSQNLSVERFTRCLMKSQSITMPYLESLQQWRNQHPRRSHVR